MEKYIFGEAPDEEHEKEEALNIESPLPELGKLLFSQPINLSSLLSGDDAFREETGAEKDPGLIQASDGILAINPQSLNLKLPVSLESVTVDTDSGEMSEPPTSKEFRRICSEIVPEQIYVSGWLVAEEWSQLESRGITHVINTACAVSKCPFPGMITYLPLSIEDNRNEDILAYIYPCIEFIETAVTNGGRVLVHCMEGVSRSCSVVIGYLMWKRGLRYVEAQAFVQNGRPICQPNPSFICQLLEFEKRLLSPQKRARSCRVTLRECNGQYILLVVGDQDRAVDKRFPYIAFEPPQTLRVSVDMSSPYIDLLVQLGRDASEQIAGIERIESPFIEVVGFDTEILPIPVSSFDVDYKACYDFFQSFGQIESTPRNPEDEEPCTARSHKSHGSIDSARDDGRVQVFEYLPDMVQLNARLAFFDSDDLDSRCTYLFLMRRLTILWIGDEVIEASDSASIIAHVRRLIPRPQSEIRVVKQGSEPDEFWDLFLRTDG
jgi:hypothetical protein